MAAPAVQENAVIYELSNRPPREPDVILKPIQLPYTQFLMLKLISGLYSELMKITTIPKGDFRFYIKGGAAVPILLRSYDTFDLFKDLPMNITNDIDVECIINPSVDVVQRQKYQKILIQTMVQYITQFFSQFNTEPHIIEKLRNEWARAGFTFSGYYNGNVEIMETGFIGNNFSSTAEDSYSSLFENAEFRGLTLRDSMFKVVVYPNYFFGSRPLNMSVIKIHPMLHGEAGQSIVDIVMPKISNDMINWEWISGAEIIFDVGNKTYVPVADPYSVYIDQRVAEALNTRPEKRAARAHRAELMKKYIFYPRTSQRVRRNLLKTRRNVIRGIDLTLKNGRKPANIIANTEWSGPLLDIPLPKWYYLVKPAGAGTWRRRRGT